MEDKEKKPDRSSKFVWNEGDIEFIDKDEERQEEVAKKAAKAKNPDPKSDRSSKFVWKKGDIRFDDPKIEIKDEKGLQKTLKDLKRQKSVKLQNKKGKVYKVVRKQEDEFMVSLQKSKTSYQKLGNIGYAELKGLLL